jgi:hypothetical protein
METINALQLVENETEQNIQDASEFTSEKIRHQALIILYGLGNQGKTSTLTDLLFLLTNAQVKHFVNKNFTKKDKKGLLHYKDGYYVLRYKGKGVFISTYGDGRIECERNKDFFECKEIDVPIYVIDGKTVRELKSMSDKEQQRKYYDVKPNFLISACRTEGGSVDATMYLANKLLSKIQQEVWIRKFGIKEGELPEYIDLTYPIITKDDDNVARDIRAFINRVRNNEHCI